VYGPKIIESALCGSCFPDQAGKNVSHVGNGRDCLPKWHWMAKRTKLIRYRRDLIHSRMMCAVHVSICTVVAVLMSLQCVVTVVIGESTTFAFDPLATRAAAIRAAFGYDALPTKATPDFVTSLQADPSAHPGGQNEGITPNTTVLTWTITEVRQHLPKASSYLPLASSKVCTTTPQQVCLSTSDCQASHANLLSAMMVAALLAEAVYNLALCHKALRLGTTSGGSKGSIFRQSKKVVPLHAVHRLSLVRAAARTWLCAINLQTGTIVVHHTSARSCMTV
jgi:hypothetical protein